MILMEFSTDTEKFLLYSKEAYYKFQTHQIPFAAVKLYFSGLGDESEKIDDIVGNNFRTDKDFILKSENNYAILMHNTSLQTAEAAINRISKKLYQLRYEAKIKKSTKPLNSNACIYATSEENTELEFRHLKLVSPSKNKNETNKKHHNIGEYLRWTKPIRNERYMPFSIKV